MGIRSLFDRLKGAETEPPTAPVQVVRPVVSSPRVQSPRSPQPSSSASRTVSDDEGPAFGTAPRSARMSAPPIRGDRHQVAVRTPPSVAQTVKPVFEPEDDGDDESRSLAPASARGTSLVPATVKREPIELYATTEEVEKFLEYDGEVLTCHGGKIQVTDRQRENAAFLQNGTFLIAKGKHLDSVTMQVRAIIRRADVPIHSERHVDRDVIRKIHENAEKRFGSKPGKRNFKPQEMQKAFFSLIGEMALRHCSDIRIRVERNETKIRMHLDGVVQDYAQESTAWGQLLLGAAFAMADSSGNSYRPLEYQDARISNVSVPLPDGVQSLRLQFNPLANSGTLLVIRLLYASSKENDVTDIDQLGYAQVHVRQIRRMRKKTVGINIICGPTGSGKSTTLTHALKATMREKKYQVAVVTVEDPPEFVIEGTDQLPVVAANNEDDRNEKFTQAIRATLRNAPHIIMIGEVRDGASAKLAFAAAMTGHQVYASLHANNAYGIIDRLADLGVENYKLADTSYLTGLIGQRLIRRPVRQVQHPVVRNGGFQAARRRHQEALRTHLRRPAILGQDRRREGVSELPRGTQGPRGRRGVHRARR